jgi:hypothetical protein
VIVHDVAQGSTEWKMARMGIPTASQFGRILSSKTLKPLAGAETYMLELLTESLLGFCEGEDGSQFMDRGREMEEEAVAWFELEKGVDATKVGFITNDEGTAGCSPDRLVGEDAGLEVKCPAAKTHLGYLLSQEIPADYIAQIQGGLYLTGRAHWDFCSYNPVLPPWCIRVERDETYITALASALGAFTARLADARARLLRLGVVPVLESSGNRDGLVKVVSDVLC